MNGKEALGGKSWILTEEVSGRGRKQALDQPTHSRGPWCWVVTGNSRGRPGVQVTNHLVVTY